MQISTIKTTLILLFASLIFVPSMADEKKQLDASVYDGWKSIDRGYAVSNDGKFVSYVIKPQKGDTYLYLYNVATEELDSVPRGKSPVFSYSNQFVAFNVLPQADSIRALKLEKVKKDKLPKDSLFIMNLSTGEMTKIADISKWSAPKKGGDWVAYLLDKEVKKKDEPKDTTKVEEAIEEKKDKKDKKKKSFKSKGKPLVFYRPSSGDSLYIEKVNHYTLAEDGSAAYIVQSIGDTTEVSKVLKFNPQSFTVDTLFKQIGKVEKIASAYDGAQCAFFFSPDTADVKVYRLYHFAPKMKVPQMIIDTLHVALPAEWAARTKGDLKFSKNGERLFFEAGLRPSPEPKDTLVADEKTHVDIWGWKDMDIQPMQKKNLSKEKDPSYNCVYHIKKKQVVQLADEQIKSVEVLDKGNGNIAIGYDSAPYRWARTYSGRWAADIYKIDIITGQRTLLVRNHSGEEAVAENGSWIAYYNANDGQYYSVNIKTGANALISKGANVSFADELHDTPNEATAYGIEGFTSDNKFLVVYDRYDIWKLDLTGKTDAQCLTNGNGRKHTTEYRYVKLDKEEKTVDLAKDWLLTTFNDLNKQSGFSKLSSTGIEEIMMGDYRVYSPIKAKKADVMLWRKSTFTQYPELRLSQGDLTQSKVISNTNPQQRDYVWGDIQLVDWVASDGLTHQGLLITPENLDPNQKYPMISYFYERYSDNLHGYRAPAPSRSTVNWNFYASNGYIIFVPDIFYRDGDPGLCAYEAVVSGCLAMADRFSFIDREHMGIQGQSWGGYQVAYLVTRTNLFKAGMAGAPVSNMTSAYGGIRWGSGMSRQFQYEKTQSRIGGTLWEKTNKYIENSPVFFAPQVETPLLMMHNDKDGAVPWYQGIEYYMALRRLEKPVWMLVYNDEEHNLTRRANSKDLSIRMMQFFNHYLKGESVPVWMHDGIPAVKKGKELGYDLVE
ncbi:S9 family peptidase [Carboxylicivirga mesophila]|uniref:S9 family peptidase n=1 Tax=Carboxylicivirga mesophila TaxID=1166478 RepID=A0ABS5KAB6_9BACT|nr:prolyl oligopeptidase family serine peptidase [Carboxylicivirga mesophila]MBS2211832.1 S9 family peptidase [Carboxylicivirga mesophila]